MKNHPPYTEDDWQVDYAAGVKLTCPDCGWRDPERSLLNYYNVYSVPRPDGSVRRYRLCKKCGFGQEADRTPAYRCWHSHHTCVLPGPPQTGECAHCGTKLRPDSSGTVVHHCGWFLRPSESGYTCQTCGDFHDRDSEVPWPAEGSG